jgi:CO/xanthine dehydrogenase Mo-binding subunit
VAVPGIAPAVATAWAKLTGTRIRTLPMFPGQTMGG